jgi:hypothetical protein
VDGALREGQRITVTLRPPEGRGATIRPTVLEAEPGRRLRWLGRFLIPGLFDGEHTFTLDRLDDGRVRLVHEEHFKGALVPLLSRSLDRGTRAGFEQMNRALKQRAEGAARHAA